MSDSENLKILKEAYALWNDSKAESGRRWIALLDDKVVWRSLGDGMPGMEFSRPCDCKDDVIRYFEELAVDWSLVHYTVDEFVCQGDRIVMLGRCAWTHRRTGKTVETPKADILRMKDGKITEFFEFFDTAQAIAAARG